MLTMNKLLISCGCSFTHGNTVTRHENFVPYGDLVAQSLGWNHINLSKPGASNYFIAKQIEHCVDLCANFVCVGATTPWRFDFLKNANAIERPVCYDDFQSSRELYHDNKILSTVILYYLEQSKNAADASTRQAFSEICDFFQTKLNLHIKQDQDSLMILGACARLQQAKIPYVILDFGKIFQSWHRPVIDLDYRQLSQQFPCQFDTYHFNQHGQNFVAAKIKDFISNCENIASMPL